jgi:hypothetical protein
MTRTIMKTRNVARLCAVVILLIAVGFAFGCSSPGQAQSTNPSSSQVTVVNTTAQPVPVTGNVGVSGSVPVTGNVGINGTPAVSVSGTVPVANPLDSNANPIPLTTLSAEAAKSFVADQDCTFNNTNICTISPVFTVPAGKTAVIESVTGSCVYDASTALALAHLFYLNNGSVIGGVPGPAVNLPSLPAIVFGSLNASSFAVNVKTYIPASTAVNFIVHANASQTQFNTDECNVSVSGYFVP